MPALTDLERDLKKENVKGEKTCDKVNKTECEENLSGWSLSAVKKGCRVTPAVGLPMCVWH